MPLMNHIHRELNLEEGKGMQWGGVSSCGRRKTDNS